MKEIYLATTNKWKVMVAREAIEKKFGIKIIPIDLDLPEIQDSDPIVIAKKSVMEAFEKLKKPVIKCDSGISIKALNGFPGPYSNYVQKTIGVEGILSLMKGVADRSAKIYSVVCFYDGKTEPKVFVSENQGELAEEKRGTNGYFFDFIFIPRGSNKVLAEFDDTERWVFWKEAYEKFGKWYSKI